MHFEDENFISFTEVPAMIWNPRYLKGQAGLELFHRHIQHVSDYMLMGGPTLYNSSPNKGKLYDIFEGRVDKLKDDYKRAAQTWGVEGSAPVRDFSFFESTSKSIVGTKLDMPFEFDVTDVSEAELKRRLGLNKTFATERVVRETIGMASQQGLDLGFAANKDIHIPQSEAEIDEILNGPSDNEVRIYKGLKHMNEALDLTDEFKECVKDKFVLNAQFAHVYYEDGQVRIKREAAENVRWISVNQIKTLEAASAVSLLGYLEMGDMIAKYGHLFDGKDSLQGVIDTVRGRKKDKSFFSNSFHYQPHRLHLERAELASIMAGDADNMYGAFNWEEVFYPRYGDEGTIIKILEHQMYFKMIRYEKAKVLINGKNATKESYMEYRMKNFDSKFKARYIPVEEDHKPKAGEYIIRYPKVELWQATRLGHCSLVDIRKCPHADEDLKRKEPRFPVIGRINYERSMVKLGEVFSLLDNIILNRVEEVLNLGGATSALLIDDAQVSQSELQGIMHSAKKAGVLRYNSTKMPRTDAAMRHLTQVKLTNEDNNISNLLALSGLLEQKYGSMIGMGPERQGQGNKYDAAGKVNTLINQQNLLTASFYYEDSLFTQDCLQRAGEFMKAHYSTDSYRTLKTDKDTNEIVRFGPDLAKGDYRIDYRNGINLLRKKEKLEQMAQAVLPSGGVDAIEALVDMIFEDSPLEAQRVFKQGLEALRQTQNASAQAQGQAAQGRNQVEAQKVEMDKYKADLNSETQIKVTQMKIDGDAEQTDAQGDLTDIQAAQQMQQMAVQQAQELQTAPEEEPDDSGIIMME